MRTVCLPYEGYPIPPIHGIHEAAFLCPPAYILIPRDRVELLEPEPFDSSDYVGRFALHGFFSCKVLSRCTMCTNIRDGRIRTTRRVPSLVKWGKPDQIGRQDQGR